MDIYNRDELSLDSVHGSPWKLVSVIVNHLIRERRYRLFPATTSAFIVYSEDEYGQSRTSPPEKFRLTSSLSLPVQTQEQNERMDISHNECLDAFENGWQRQQRKIFTWLICLSSFWQFRHQFWRLPDYRIEYIYHKLSRDHQSFESRSS